MPTPVSSARQCLAAEAATSLDDAVAVARRRQHAQTTSLHVVFALLSSSSSASSSSASPSSSPSSSLLRDALSRARSSAYSPRLQFKALELCFGVALDRLPSTSLSSSPSSDEPPVSNSLMAAIKRSQANQRRHPDTFQFYQQQQQQQMMTASSSSSSSFSGVKVELQQLVLAILDDPVVSRVFGEAGFRSTDIKMAVLRPPPPPILRFPRSARCPPLFLCNFSSAADDFESINLTPRAFTFPFSSSSSSSGASGGDNNCRVIGEILAKRSGRNPMLVGVGAADAARDFALGLERQNWGALPPELPKLRFLSLERELLESEGSDWLKGKLEDLGREEDGVVVGIGDLKVLVDLGDHVLNCLVSEITRALEGRRDRLWVMGWSATYETYMKFLSRYPTLDKDWDLHLQLITSVRPAMGGLLNRAASLMESFVPFGGLFPAAYETNVPVVKTYQSVPRCRHCNENYEQELVNVMKSCSPSHEDQHMANLPSWLRSADMVNENNPPDAKKAKDDEQVLSARVADLQKKWNDHCQRLHQGFLKPEANKHQILPPIIGVPYISNKSSSMNPSVMNPCASQSLRGFSSAIPVTVGLQKMSATSHISSSLVPEPMNKDLLSTLRGGPPRSEQQQTEGLRPQSALTDLSTHENRTSPPSVTSVTTDLVLGTVREPSCTNKLVRCSSSKKLDEFSPRQCLPGPDILFSSSCMPQKFDLGNFKSLYSSFMEKVGRQEVAVYAISQAIINCKNGPERRRGASLKGDIWLSFLGPDRFGKKRAAAALAELMFGSRENLICVNFAYQDRIISQNSICDHHEIRKYDECIRGKTVADHIAGEISKKPLSVVFLENVDKADFFVQERLLQAIHTGKFSDSTRREFGISNAIFVVTADKVWGKNWSPRAETGKYCEEKILAAEKWEMKMLTESTRRHPSVTISIPLRQDSMNKQIVSKRKLDLSVCHSEQQEFVESPKRAHKVSNPLLDLNLPVEEELENDVDCSSGSNSGGGGDGEDAWLEELFESLDANVNFEPFDFDKLADYVMEEVSKRFSNTIGSDCSMEIDLKAMEQILAASWSLEDIRDLDSWFHNVLLRCFVELRGRYSNKLSPRSVVRLVACKETFTDGYSPQILLPSRIILD